MLPEVLVWSSEWEGEEFLAAQEKSGWAISPANTKPCIRKTLQGWTFSSVRQKMLQEGEHLPVPHHQPAQKATESPSRGFVWELF